MSKPNKTNKTKNSILKSLDSLEESTFEDATDLITISFKYFCVNQTPVGQVFADWKDNMRLDLLQKFSEYTKYSRQHWKNEFSNGLPLLAEYGNFPLNSDFLLPKNIPCPDELIWSRFRLIYKKTQSPSLHHFFLRSRILSLFLRTSGNASGLRTTDITTNCLKKRFQNI